MKTAIIISEGLKQIMFTPENDNEKQALKMISPEDDISIEIHQGRFSDKSDVMGYQVSECRGGYLRAWQDNDSVMLMLRPKKPETTQ
jgi:hypothetical protein